MDIRLLREEVFRIESWMTALAHYAEGGIDCDDIRGHIEHIVPVLAKQGKESVFLICQMLKDEEHRQKGTDISVREVGR